MRRTIALVAVLLVCASCFTGVSAAAHEEPDRSILGFELDADGDAEVYYIQSHSLNDTQQRERYESFETNESKRTAHREAILEELQGAAADGRNATELDMHVHNGSIRTYEQGGYGRVAVRAEWENLAFANEERVVVTEPFRSGYAPDLTRVGIHGPEGYRRGTTQPSPIRARQNSSLWNPLTSNFSVFYAEFVDPEAAGTDGDAGGENGSDENDGTGDGSGDSGDGAGVFLQALALALVPVALVLLARRRQ